MICVLPSDRGEKRGTLAGFALGAGAIAAVALICGQAFGQQAIAPPKVTASAVFVLNADTGQPLYHKNENQAVRILSVTKWINAYVLVQRLGGQLSDAVTITQAHHVGGSTAGLRKATCCWSPETMPRSPSRITPDVRSWSKKRSAAAR
jgi:D-alanyl-D-alanine carboxypeptidase